MTLIASVQPRQRSIPMRKAAARDGDTTTTGGRVFAFTSPIKDKGRAIAFDGSEATCGNCEGFFPIHGTGQKIFNAGRYVVVDDDMVLCPCGKNRVVVGNSPSVWLATRRGSERAVEVASLANPERFVADDRLFDEQVQALSTPGALEGHPYYVEMADGPSRFGRVDSGGSLPRMSTGASLGQYVVYWGEDALIKASEG
jgi:hypothetical protein